MNTIYQALLEYLHDDKLLIDYLYVIYNLLSKYGKTVYDFIDEIRKVDDKLAEVIVFFQEENFDRKDVSDLLMYGIEKTGYNVLEIELGKWVDVPDLSLPEGEKIVKEKPDDAGLMIKTADGKIYKRFVLDDVKKMLDL